MSTREDEATAKVDGRADEALGAIAALCRAAERCGEGEGERCEDALRSALKKSEETRLGASAFADARFAACGKIVNGLRKRHAEARVRDAAATVKARWTEMIIAAQSETPVVVKEDSKETVASDGAVKAEKKTDEETAAKSALDEAKAAVKAAVTRVNDASRDRTREIFAESLAVCVTEDESIAPESLATIAGQIESAMSAKWPDGGKDFKAKVRQLSFNLRDAKNPDLRSSVASGEIAADVLIDLAPEELGSNERRKANEKIREHAEWEAVRGQQQQASTDAFKCGKCKQRKCTYYQLQTRSADEPMTSTFVFMFYFSPWRCFFPRSRAPFRLRRTRRLTDAPRAFYSVRDVRKLWQQVEVLLKVTLVLFRSRCFAEDVGASRTRCKTRLLIT